MPADAAIGGGRTFSLTSMAAVAVQCGSSRMTTHMYMHRRGVEGESELPFFGFVPSVSVAIPPPFGREVAEQLYPTAAAAVA